MYEEYRDDFQEDDEFKAFRDVSDQHIRDNKSYEAQRAALDPPCSDCYSVPCKCTQELSDQRQEETIERYRADGYEVTVKYGGYTATKGARKFSVQCGFCGGDGYKPDMTKPWPRKDDKGHLFKTKCHCPAGEQYDPQAQHRYHWEKA